MLPIDTHDVTAREHPDAGAVTERMVLLAVDGYRIAVSIGKIREVIPARPYTPLPGSGHHVCGLINLRGRIVTVLDVAARLGLAPASSDPGHSLVVVEHEGKPVGLAVNDVSRIVEVDLEALGDAVEAFRALSLDRSYLLGVGEADGEMFVAVDPDRIIAPLLSA
jgi:purine-binding chemotaxis protein CheW